MTGAGGAEIVRGLVAHARTLGNGVVAHVGISMGGYYSARSGLAGEVDAAVVLGGPVEAAFTGGARSRDVAADEHALPGNLYVVEIDHRVVFVVAGGEGIIEFTTRFGLVGLS